MNKGQIKQSNGGYIGEFNRADGHIGDFHRVEGCPEGWENDPNIFDECFNKTTADDSNSQENGSGFRDWFDWGLGSADSILDLRNKLQDGTEVSAGNINTTINPGSPAPSNDMKMWYIAGGVLVLLVVVGVVVKKS